MKTILLYLALVILMYNTTGVEQCVFGAVFAGVFGHSMWQVFKGIIEAKGGKL